MIAIPAIDLREGACVQLVGGAYDAEKVRLPDPLAVARKWAGLGFSRLHVVDLDAATGRGSNLETVRSILGAKLGTVQVGGGVRDEDRCAELLQAGADRVIVGTRAVEDFDWLTRLARRFPGRVSVAADVRGRTVLTRGWKDASALEVLDWVEQLNALPLGGLLVTAVHLEGQQQGTDLALMADVAQASRHPLHASGGVTTLEDLRALAKAKVAGAVIGMALYTGTLDAAAAAREFGR